MAHGHWLGALVGFSAAIAQQVMASPRLTSPAEDRASAEVSRLDVATTAQLLRAVQDGQGLEAWSGHASYTLGYKRHASEWSPVRDQVEFGIFDVDLRPPGWTPSLCLQLLTTYASAPPDVEGAEGDYSGTWEINVGVRRCFPLSPGVELFGGGGLSWLGASASSWVDFGSESAQVYEASDYTLGWWCSAGAYWHLAEGLHLGLEVQYSVGEVELFEQPVEAGGFHALLMFGTSW